MKGLERVLFECESYHQLGRLYDQDVTWGEIRRGTEHLLELIPLFFEIMGYLPDLVSGGLTGLAKAAFSNYVGGMVADTLADGNLGVSIAASTAISMALHGRPKADDFDRALEQGLRKIAERGPDALARALAEIKLPKHLSKLGSNLLEETTREFAQKADDAARLAGADVARAADSALGQVRGRAAEEVDEWIEQLQKVTAEAESARVNAEPRVIEGANKATDAAETAGKPAMDAVPPPDRANAPPQKLLEAPKFKPSELDTAKASGLRPDQVRALGNLLGQRFDGANMRKFLGPWNKVRARYAREIQEVFDMLEAADSRATGRRQGAARRARVLRYDLKQVSEQAREVFGNIRDDFWVAIRDAQGGTELELKQLLEEAGIVFLGDAKAPVVTMRTQTGYGNVRLNIDHIQELSQQPAEAFSAKNFRLTLQDENTIVLNQIHAQDPFQADVRKTWGRGTSRAGKLIGNPNYRGRSPIGGLLPDPANPSVSSQAAADARTSIEAQEALIDALEPDKPF